MTLLDSLLWGRELERVQPKSSPSSPSSPTQSTSEPSGWTSFWFGDRDAYARRAQAALNAICAIPAPEGLIVWLRENSPVLYKRLICELPDKISRAWDARIAYTGFEAICSELVDTFRRGAELYHVRAGSKSTDSPSLVIDLESDERGIKQGHRVSISK